MKTIRLQSLLSGFAVSSCFLLTAACTKEPSTSPPKPKTEEVQPSPSAGSPSPAGPSNSAGSVDTALDLEEAARATITTKWTGDLDGMIKRRIIRVLTTYSKVSYFVDQGRPRGLVYDAFRLFEDDLNAKLRTKNVRVHVLFVPVAHDDLIPALVDGRGDIVSSGTLLTEWRRAQVDFTNPTRSNVSSLIVTGPGVAPVPAPLDLGGREVYLRLSDVSKQGVDQFQATLKAAGRPPVKILPAPEVLADEDILEMVNAGLVPAALVDDYQAEFWQKVFPNLVLNRGAAVRSNLQTGMLLRKNSPQLLAELNGFLAKYPEGSARRNMLFNEYLKSVKWAKNATADAERAKFDKTVDLFRQYSGRYKPRLPADGRAGLSGVATRPAGEKRRRGDRRHAGDAGDRDRAQGG